MSTMNNLSDKSLFDLANRMNQIEVEIQKLQLEYNLIVHEIKERIPSLKDDKNLEPKVIKKIKGE